MHDHEMPIDLPLVRRLMSEQFPQWAHLPLARLRSAGTVHAVYRLGDEFTVRLPRVEGATCDVLNEHHWLPRLAPLLPFRIPEVVGKGEPDGAYPWPWSVHRWVEGENPLPDHLADPSSLALDLARFTAALRRVDTRDAPLAYRGGPLAEADPETRDAIAQLDGIIDTAAAGAAWDTALRAPVWTGPPVWVHADLMPGNLLLVEDRLTAVIDFGTMGVGDPACDLIPAWNLLPGPARDLFRAESGADEATWQRGRGWALSMALIQLPYYQDTNPVLAANARHVIRTVLADRATGVTAADRW
jgi:aminoglycoside phosphotransferase (APT) family kinase protein